MFLSFKDQRSADVGKEIIVGIIRIANQLVEVL